MASFIITLTYEGKPVIFRFISSGPLEEHLYEVSALNERSFAPFLIVKLNGHWRITTEVMEGMKKLEEKLHIMIEAYLEGHKGKQ